MLVLSRHVAEAIVIANGIKVTIVGIRGGVVKLGIEAPKDVPVHRQEVHEAIEKERRNGTDERNGHRPAA